MAQSFRPLPRTAEKTRRTFYLFQRDLEDLDAYFDLRERAAAIKGQPLAIKKTEAAREAFHDFVNSYIRPRLAAVRGELHVLDTKIQEEDNDLLSQ
jgi:hypothetical protein